MTKRETQLREYAAEATLAADPGPCPYVTGTVTRFCTLTPFTITPEERDAITEASEFYIGTRTGVALRGLLERMGVTEPMSKEKRA